MLVEIDVTGNCRHVVTKLPEFSDHCPLVWWGNRLTDAHSTWLTPRPVRKTVDELKTVQVKSSVALELLILTKVIILLPFLSEEEVNKCKKCKGGYKYKLFWASFFSFHSTCYPPFTPLQHFSIGSFLFPRFHCLSLHSSLLLHVICFLWDSI